MASFFTGLFVCLVGVGLIIWSTEVDRFLPFNFSNSIIGTGASAYKVIGVAVIGLSFLIMFGVLNLG